MSLYTNFSIAAVATAGVVFPVVGVVLVCFRLRLSRKRNTRFSVEDGLALGALVFLIGMGVAAVVGVATNSEGNLALSQQGQDWTTQETVVSKVFWTTEWMQPLALGCTKLSFVFFYRRMFNVRSHREAYYIVSTAAIVLIAVWMLGFFLAVILICPGHVSDFWGSTLLRADHCWRTTNFLYILCWSDAGTDLLVLLMPIPPVWRLQITLRQKVALAGVFALGALAFVASIIRAALYMSLLQVEKSVLATYDPSMINTNGIYWMLVEAGLALIALNLPLLYGAARTEGVATVVRRPRSFVSLRSMMSTQRRRNSRVSSAHNIAVNPPAVNPPAIPSRVADPFVVGEDIELQPM